MAAGPRAGARRRLPQALLSKHLPTLCARHPQADEAKEAYWKTHCDPATTGERNGGAHFAYLEALLKKSSSGWTAGTAEPNVADVQLFDVFDLHARIFGDKLKVAYPTLAALHDRFAGIPEIKAYLESDRRPAAVNGVPLG
eukprot:363059-Chlamydomonas_euryale.AAC.3